MNRTKYPKTFHFPWSPNLQNDDRMLENIEHFLWEEIVITEKMDGENTTMYSDYVHARSIDYSPREDRDWMKQFHSSIKADIPDGWRICGEQLYAEHSIHYENLPSYFLMFSIWNNKNECLSWLETEEWAKLLGIQTVPVLYKGYWDKDVIEQLNKKLEKDRSIEGYVIRIVDSFIDKDFGRVVGKYVRSAHVQTDEHWTRRPIVRNGLKSN